MATFLFLLALVSQLVNGDIYLHAPRGSNNRLDEANRDRANGNRLFDSQNNNRGGYNVGSVYYTHGSRLNTQWTAQHSCGAANNKCELIIQYMCDAQLRDGTKTTRIPADNNQCYKGNCDTDTRYGRQESQEWYNNCTARQRNMGLFTAAQNVKSDATSTRQNPNAQRYGYECAEERDYYPYWYPSPWVDVAVLTNDPTRCTDYQARSENVLGRWYCDPPKQLYDMNMATGKKGWIPITKHECTALVYVDEETQKITNGSWIQAPAHGEPAPQCVQNVFSRDNHLGNVVGGYMAMYNWTVPAFNHEQCAWRTRYNITTTDYKAWDASGRAAEVGDVHAGNNTEFKNPGRDPANLALWEDYHLTYDEVEPSFNRATNNDATGLLLSREYVFRDNPNVDIFGGLLKSAQGTLKLQLNINTNQFGRTFQDRSHRFLVRPSNSECEGVTTHNLQVRGKRGNIVQVYPGVEYDFVPEHLHVQTGECVHIQWTGSNTNPNNNDGQGRQGTDRSNIVVLRAPVYGEGQPETSDGLVTFGQFGASFPASILKTAFLGLGDADEESLAILNSHQLGGEMSELDDAGTWFDLKPRKVTTAGIFHYLSTRNNNFSNRSQKGKVVVNGQAMETATVGWNGGTLEASNGAAVTIAEGTFQEATQVVILTEPALLGETRNIVSDFIRVYMATEVAFDLSIPFDYEWEFNGHSMYYNEDSEAVADISTDGWSTVSDMTIVDGTAYVVAAGPGTYVVSTSDVHLFWAITIPLLVVLCLVVTVVLCKKTKPDCCTGSSQSDSSVSSGAYKKVNGV